MSRGQLALLAPLLLACASCCAVNPATGRLQLMLVSEREEIRIGDRVAPQVEMKFGGVYHDREIAPYVRELGERIAAVSHRPHLPWSFQVLRTDLPNAFALPGGRVYITRGLLLRLENEAQLAAALAHEVAHVSARHSASALSSSIALRMVKTLGVLYLVTREKRVETLIAVSLLTDVVIALYLSGYSRGQEYEADKFGAEYSHAAGYNPIAFAQLLRLLAGLESGGSGSFLSTHPKTGERIREMEEILARDYPDVKPTDDLFNERLGSVLKRRAAYGHLDRARLERRRGDREAALRALSEAEKVAPEDPEVKLEAAQLRGTETEAEAALRAAVENDPGDVGALLDLGGRLLARGDGAAAEPHYRRAVELVPQEPELHEHLARALRTQGKNKQAREEEQIARELRKRK